MVEENGGGRGDEGSGWREVGEGRKGKVNTSTTLMESSMSSLKNIFGNSMPNHS